MNTAEQLPTEYIISNVNLPVCHMDPEHAQATPDALHIKDGTIAGVFSQGNAPNTGAASRTAGSTAPSGLPVYDLGGLTVLPGFIDNHVHTLVTGDLAEQLDLQGLDWDAIRALLLEHHAGTPPGEVIRGYGWDYPHWPNPHKHVLDKISTSRPIVLFQFSGHAACVNSAMLSRLGITAATADPPDGSIGRDASGDTTGILREGASRPLHIERMRRVNRDRSLVEHLLLLGQESFARHGISSVGDNTWYAGSAFGLARLRKTGRLLTRVSAWSLGSAPGEAARMHFTPYDGRLLRRGPVKYFLDGAFSSHTALLLEPYQGEPENYGTAVLYGEKLMRVLSQLTRRGRQGAFHAIGDAAVRNFLRTAENVAERRPEICRLRHRLEHAQLVAAPDMVRLARLGIVVAAQPHALSSPEKDAQLLGAERAARAYPYRSLLDAGVRLCFGSDSPAEPSFEPLVGIRNACLRTGPERITVREAVECYTTGSAYAEGTEDWKGRIAPGYAADLVVLSQDPLELDRTGNEAPLREARVVATIMDGRLVSSVSTHLPTRGRPHRSSP